VVRNREALVLLAFPVLAGAFVECTGEDPDLAPSTDADGGASDASNLTDTQNDVGIDPLSEAGPPAPDGQPVWSMIFDPADRAYVATDATGHVYVAVGFNGTNVAFGDKTLSSTGKDVGVVKLTPDGKQALWAAKIGGDSIDDVNAISVDANGGVYVAGSFYSAMLDASGKQLAKGTANEPHGYIAKLSAATGAGEWVQGFTITEGGFGLEGADCRSVRARGAAVAFSCDFLGQLTYPGGTKSQTDRRGTIFGVLDPATGIPKATQFLQSSVGGGGIDEVVATYAVDLDAAGNFYLAGSTKATQLVLGGDPILQSQRKGPTSGFVIKLKPDVSPSPLWFRIIGSTVNASASASSRDVLVDSTRSHVYVTGNFALAVDLGFGEVTTQDAGPATDVFLASYDLQGTPLWEKPFGGEGFDSAGQVDVDPWGRPVMSADLNSVTSAVIDGKALPSGNLIVALKLDPTNGKALSVTGRRSTNSVKSHGLSSSPANGHTLVSGQLSGSIELEVPRSPSSGQGGYVVDLTP
jgi:hypothetical protein